MTADDSLLRIDLARVPDGGTWHPTGAFTLDQPLPVTRRHITINLTAARITWAPSTARDRPALWIQGGDVTLIGDPTRPTLLGPTPRAGAGSYLGALEGQHAILVSGAERFTATGIVASGFPGDGLNLGRAPDWGGPRAPTRNADVGGCVFTNMGRHGVAWLGVDGADIHDNIIYNTGRATLNAEVASPDTGAVNSKFRDNWTGRSNLLMVAARGRGGPSHDNQILRNVVFDDCLDIWLGDLDGAWRDNWLVQSNRSDTPCGNDHHAALRAWKIRGLVATDNTQPVSLRQEGAVMCFAELNDCPEAVIARNALGKYGAGQVVGVGL